MRNIKATVEGRKGSVEIVAKYFVRKDGVRTDKVENGIYRIAGREFHTLDKIEFTEITETGFNTLATISVDNTNFVHRVKIVSSKKEYTLDRGGTRKDSKRPLSVDNIDIGPDLEHVTSSVFDELGLSGKAPSAEKVIKKENEDLKAKLAQNERELADIKAQLEALLASKTRGRKAPAK